jgi:hypothetical protein
MDPVIVPDSAPYDPTLLTVVPNPEYELVSFGSNVSQDAGRAVVEGVAVRVFESALVPAVFVAAN